ncbi:MAG TPA: rRNA maturation RNase YbeY [Gemmataceae bacterium]|jgi:probable rRNA maturation factor|nr:rRNA maturation RNase YbeY [Gemmataceae bacterium]
MIRVTISNPQELLALDYPKLRETARVVLEGENVKEARVSFAFVDNPTIHKLNLRYLDHDEPTDVLSFPLSGPGARTLEGEIVIGAEVGKAQAAERGHDVSVEVALYAIHGLLHLCGYDDHSEKGRKEMRERERHYLVELGYPDIAEKE